MSTELNYDDSLFPSLARKLVANGQMFFFFVKGDAAALLKPHLVGGGIADAPRLGLQPKLQPLLGVLMLAAARGMTTSFHQASESEVCVWIGIGKA